MPTPYIVSSDVNTALRSANKAALSDNIVDGTAISPSSVTSSGAISGTAGSFSSTLAVTGTGTLGNLTVGGNVKIGQNQVASLISGVANGGAVQILADSGTENRNVKLGFVDNLFAFTPGLTLTQIAANGYSIYTGIGNTNPTERLHVTGNIKASGSATFGSVVSTGTITSGGLYVTTAFQSSSDFVDGTLVTTNIDASVSNGDSFIMEVSGKSYSDTNPPFKFIVQGYLYDDDIVLKSGINYGGIGIDTVKIFEEGGFLKFWWPRVSYWNSFNVTVRGANGGLNYNRVTAISDSTEPTGTKKVTVTMQHFLRMDESNDGDLVLTGGVSAVTGTFSGRIRAGAGLAGPLSQQLGVNVQGGNAAGLQLFQDGVASWVMRNPPAITDLVFEESGVETMRLKTNGNVGIGTTSPGGKLDVAGSAVTGGDATYRGDLVIRQSGNSNTSNGGLELKVDGNGSGHGSRLMSVFDGVDSYGFGIAMRSNSTNWTNRLMILPSGNVGIGTTSPSEKLDVVGNIQSSAQVIGQGIAAIRSITSSTNAGIRFDTTNTSSGSERNWYVGSNNDAYGDFSIVQSNAQGGNPLAAGTTRVHISNAGKVMIGTTTSNGAELQVNGVITGTSGSFSGSGGVTPLGVRCTYAPGLYTAYGLYGTSALPANFYTDGAGYALMGYEDNGLGAYAPRIGFGLLAPGPGATHVLSKSSIGLVSDGAITIKTGVSGPADDGIERMRVSHAGLVGINTSEPLSVLSVGLPSVLNDVEAIVTSQGNPAVYGTTFTNAGMYGVRDATVAQGLAFKTYKASVGLIEAMRISNGGNVGIGTSSPLAKIALASTPTAAVGSGPTTNSRPRPHNPGGTPRGEMGLQSSSPYGMWIRSSRSNSFALNDPLLLQPTGGNVGIGTTSPSEKLDVAGNAWIADTVFATKLSFFHDDTNYYIGGAGVTNGYTIHTYDTIRFTTGSGSGLFTFMGANVGIGTTTPGEKLDVTGNIKASGTIKPGAYTVAEANALTAATAGAGAIIYVSNETGGAVIAFSDGTDWRRVTDRAIIA